MELRKFIEDFCDTEVVDIDENSWKVMGDLDLSNSEIDILPPGLVEVRGDVILSYTQIKDLNNLKKIKGNLDMRMSPLIRLPEDLEVGGEVRLEWTEIQVLPNNMKVGKDFFINSTKVRGLPLGLEVGGNLNLNGLTLTKLPSDLKVKGEITGQYEVRENSIDYILRD